MPRFYDTHHTLSNHSPIYRVSVSTANGKVDIEVSETIYEEIGSLQREFWRIERREARHTYHIEQMSDCDLPYSRLIKSPEQLLMERLETDEIRQALQKIPPLQLRRFLLRHLIDLPIKQIAQIEGCSERAIKYSLALARENLKELLS
ncbi:RNA polymerase sigma factor [Eggerthella timonensis]|uniref:RNA polymerase sigma factor n=1 Tax=Eggerthella timonensis TaxID=1871008 RepID=UPI001FE38146|nr:sigma-70 family RNA polymerase sigma factor [Eggerthella timonensis]